MKLLPNPLWYQTRHARGGCNSHVPLTGSLGLVANIAHMISKWPVLSLLLLFYTVSPCRGVTATLHDYSLNSAAGRYGITVVTVCDAAGPAWYFTNLWLGKQSIHWNIQSPVRVVIMVISALFGLCLSSWYVLRKLCEGETASHQKLATERSAELTLPGLGV